MHLPLFPQKAQQHDYPVGAVLTFEDSFEPGKGSGGNAHWHARAQRRRTERMQTRLRVLPRAQLPDDLVRHRGVARAEAHDVGNTASRAYWRQALAPFVEVQKQIAREERVNLGADPPKPPHLLQHAWEISVVVLTLQMPLRLGFSAGLRVNQVPTPHATAAFMH